MECFSNLRGHEKPVHSIRQIVVRKNEIRLKTPVDEQTQRRRTVSRCCQAVAVLFEDQFEEFTQFSVIFDDQNRAERPALLVGPFLAIGCSPLCRIPFGASMTSMEKTDPLPSCERTCTGWPSRVSPDAERWRLPSPRP